MRRRRVNFESSSAVCGYLFVEVFEKPHFGTGACGLTRRFFYGRCIETQTAWGSFFIFANSLERMSVLLRCGRTFYFPYFGNTLFEGLIKFLTGEIFSGSGKKEKNKVTSYL